MLDITAALVWAFFRAKLWLSEIFGTAHLLPALTGIRLPLLTDADAGAAGGGVADVAGAFGVTVNGVGAEDIGAIEVEANDVGAHDDDVETIASKSLIVSKASPFSSIDDLNSE